MVEMRVWNGVKESSKKKLKSTWPGHMKKMGDEKLAKRTGAQNVEVKWRRGRPMGDCV